MCTLQQQSLDDMQQILNKAVVDNDALLVKVLSYTTLGSTRTRTSWGFSTRAWRHLHSLLLCKYISYLHENYITILPDRPTLWIQTDQLSPFLYAI